MFAFRPFVHTLAAVAVACGAPVAARADTVYAVMLGGRPIDRAGNSGLTHGGHVFVNVVNVTRALAGVLTFHDADRSTLVTVGSHSVRFTVGSRDATIDGAPATLSAAPFLSNGDTFVPLDAFARVAGTTYRTDARAKTVTLSAPVAPALAPAPAAT